MPPKYLSGSQKRKKRKRDEELTKAQRGSLDKFFKKNPQVSSDNMGVDVDGDGDQINDVNVENTNIDGDHADVDDGNDDGGDDIEDDNVVDDDVDVNTNHVDIFDPRNWERLTPDMIKILVEKGPKRDYSVDKGPLDKFSRRFSATMYTRTLQNKKTCDREWLVYSKDLDKVFCFCCKLFKKGLPKGQLDNEGYADWQHLSTRLKEHEVGLEHLTNLATWFEMRERLKVNETIDKVAYDQFKKERERWRQVILRIIALVKYLAKYSLAFRGTDEKLYTKSNGNFLGAIEMFEEFDPIMKEHVRRITNDDIHVHYLGPKIQNEVILLLAHEIKREIIKQIKEAKYYSIILDCTLDTSHLEQMSLIVRYVNFSSNSVTVEESFLGFLNVDDTTGKGLFDVTHDELKSLGLDIDDMRGQGYDNGSNMRGKHQGVQTRFLKINPRAFYTPCGCHSLNLALCDMAKSCGKVKDFFGVIQRIYTIFSNSTKRWQILKDNIKGLTPKSLSATRWESRIDSVKAITLQVSDIREALLEVAEKDNDVKIQSEAKSLATNELGEFEFLVSIVIWYQILYMVNLVSKKLQSKDMLLDVAINEVNMLIEYFKDFRETGFSKAIDEAKELSIEMEIDPIFPQKRHIRRKKQFDENSSDQDVVFSAEENFKVNYFLSIVDQASASLKTRFQQYKEYEEIFGFLFPKKLKEFDDKDLKSCCSRLEAALKYDERSDIDAHELHMELKLLDKFLPSETTNPIDVLKYMKKVDCFPNAIIAYGILLTIPVTVASAERSFSKLKLLKSYLRSTMSQERLNGLAMIAIENDILDTINYEELIDNFASKNAKRDFRFM
ncbi:hypothetical protein L2E82_27327 [Cichorium intybus]|uniref:Uncharacterized protein n=1 Tax=Cichorium intybus TaxID=13427 RepID=A0ACB9CSQ3_CICIN|nr:hypothetical protein L2E82_27327 [Cichorium intybus]